MKKSLTLILCLVLCLYMSALFVHAADGTAQYANVKPVIDGAIDDVWSTTAQFDSAYTGDNDGEGISGYAKMLWDEDYVYILAVINDATIDTSMTGSSDSVDLWFSETNSADPDSFPQTGDWVATVSPSGASADFYYIGNAEIYNHIEAATSVTATGYIVEAKIDYLTDGFAPTTGQVVGFNISFNNDLDNDGVRDSWCSWQPYDGRAYWSNTAALNTVEFVGEKVETVAETEASAAETAAQATADTTTAVQTLDIVTVASAAAVIALAGVVIIKKK